MFIENLRRQFQRSLFIRLLVINCALFLFVRLLLVIFSLFMIPWGTFLDYLQMPSSFERLLHQPWSIFTYMFLHLDFLHLLFNMLWFYWFGRIFLQFFSERQLLGVYLAGGVVGGLFFLMAYNLFPYYREELGHGTMMGASAAVMAIVFAIAFYQKEYEISLLFLGRIKLIYLALITLIVDLLSITSGNAGGHMAHIGGAVFGILFAYQQRQVGFFSSLTFSLKRLKSRFTRRKKVRKETYGQRIETDMEYRTRKKEEMDLLDAILDKLKRSGYESLSSEEKSTLFEAGKR